MVLLVFVQILLKCVLQLKSSVIATPNFVNILINCTCYSVHVLCIDRFGPFPYQLHHIAFDELESHCPVS